jgi:hypothetical protein
MEDLMHALRIIACLVFLTACAPADTAPDAASRSVASIREGVIESIDREAREVVVRGESQVINLKAGPEVTNFNQLKAGDVVRVNYYASIAARMAAPEERGTEGGSVAKGRSKVGAAPSLTVGSISEMVVEFVSYDSEKHVVTFVDPQGQMRESVVHPEMRAFAAGRKPGDLVAVTIEQAWAVSIDAG